MSSRASSIEARPAAGRWWQTTDVRLGAAVIVTAIVVFLLTLGIDKAPAALAQNVQPATFPRLVCVLLAIFGIGLMLMGASKSMAAKPRPPAPVFTTALAMLAFPPLCGWLGVPVAMVAFCLALPVLWGAKMTVYRVLFAFAFPAAVYGLFAKVLGVYFQPGLFGI